MKESLKFIVYGLKFSNPQFMKEMVPAGNNMQL